MDWDCFILSYTVNTYFKQFLQIESVNNRKLLGSEESSIRCPIGGPISRNSLRRIIIGSILLRRGYIMSGSDRDRSSSHRHRSRSRSRSKFEWWCQNNRIGVEILVIQNIPQEGVITVPRIAVRIDTENLDQNGVDKMKGKDLEVIQEEDEIQERSQFPMQL